MIGVVGDERRGDLADRLRQTKRSVVVGEAEDVVDDGPALVAALGEAALVDLVRAGVEVPVLPVGEVSGLPTVSSDDVPAVAEGFLAGEAEVLDLQLLSTSVAGDPVGQALFDAMLARAAPGRISEFGVVAGGMNTRFRADGVVVATAAGSHGYAQTAGGPRLSPATAAVAVVPVAAFGLGAPTWVSEIEAGVQLSVERDEGDVSLLVDGRERRRLSGRTTVTLTAGETLSVVANGRH